MRAFPSKGTPSSSVDLVRSRLNDPNNVWGIGSFGALAEFALDDDEDATVAETEHGGTVVTDRGALAVAMPTGIGATAYEGLSGRPDSWIHGVAFHLPASKAAMSGRSALTEQGPDRDALRPDDRAAVLFDMGLGAANVDVCVRTSDPGLLDVLREEAGHSILAEGSRAMVAIKEASPHRVFLSCMGRLEVYQRIGSTARNIPTPQGPHTHVIPGLLKSGRTHSANIPIPTGHAPGLFLYPPSPIHDPLGHAKTFDRRQFDAFQDLLAAFGPAGYIDEKQRIAAAVAEDVDPSSYRQARSRLARTGARIALRQLLHTDGPASQLAAWRTTFDRASDNADVHGH